MPDPALPPHGSLPRALCLMGIHVNIPKNQVVEGGGFEPPKLARQIYSLIPLATREPLRKGAHSLDLDPLCQQARRGNSALLETPENDGNVSV